MPNNNNQPDINKAIDVCMEEYKTLRAEILQTIQNRTNVIVFGGGLVLTLVGIGISPIANLPIMKETTTVTRIPTDTTTIETTKGKKTTTIGETTRKTISHPKGDVSHENQQTKSTLVVKEKGTATETISKQGFYDIPIERRLASAIILGIIVPTSCGLIIFLVNANTHQVVRIGRYIATNIEPKINDLYFNNLPSRQKPIVWETYMQTLRFGPEEGKWVKTVFGTIQLLGLIGAIVISWELVIIVCVILFLIFIFIVVFLSKTKSDEFKETILSIYFSILTDKSSGEIASLRDGEGSLQKIYYEGIKERNENVKATRIFWIKDIRYFTELYQIVGSMIDYRNNAIVEIEDGSLKSRLQTLGEFDLANKVQDTKALMQAQGVNSVPLLNQLIKESLKSLLDRIKDSVAKPEYQPPFYFNLYDGSPRKAVNNIAELLVLFINNPYSFERHLENGDISVWFNDVGKTTLAEVAERNRGTTFPDYNERLHYFLRECCRVLIESNP